jgi:hypothetical protein
MTGQKIHVERLTTLVSGLPTLSPLKKHPNKKRIKMTTSSPSTETTMQECSDVFKYVGLLRICHKAIDGTVLQSIPYTEA